MGVVRDVTIDNLTQAVQGISSSGISDTTGQAIKSSIDTLAKDTSAQAIASAITGLGSTLGANKADIDGGNIANPSAFRQNIGLNESTTNLTSAVSQVYRQYIKKFYNIVFCYIDINNLNTTTETTIGYLPQGYRPYHNFNHEIIVIGSSDASFKGYAHVYVKTTGEIAYKSLGSYSATFSTINLVFPTS